MADCFCCPLHFLIISLPFVLCAIVIQRTGIISYSTSAGTSILTKSLAPPTSPAPCYADFEHYRSQLRDHIHHVFCLKASVIYSYSFIDVLYAVIWFIWVILPLTFNMIVISSDDSEYAVKELYYGTCISSAFCGHWVIETVNISQEKCCTLLTQLYGRVG